MSRRIDQVASILHRAVQSVIAEGFSDPRLDGCLVTVTRVDVSSDLRTATVHVSIMPERAESRAVHGLRSAGRYVRRQAGERVALHQLPELNFKLDRGAKRQAEVFDALARARAEMTTDGAPAADEGGSEDA